MLNKHYPWQESHPHRLVMLKVGRRLIPIKLIDILFAEGSDKYVKVHTTNGSHLVVSSMCEMDELLNSEFLIRVHRSYIVNFLHVNWIERDLLHLGTGKECHEIPIHKKFLDCLRNTQEPMD